MHLRAQGSPPQIPKPGLSVSRGVRISRRSRSICRSSSRTTCGGMTPTSGPGGRQPPTDPAGLPHTSATSAAPHRETRPHDYLAVFMPGRCTGRCCRGGRWLPDCRAGSDQRQPPLPQGIAAML
jgi:hypothetical protein